MRNTANNTKVEQSMSSYTSTSNSHQHAHNESQHRQHEEPSTIGSMLSPRNIMKFFTKNIEDMVSSRPTSHPTNASQPQTHYYSHFKPAQIHKQYEHYLGAIERQMQKYRANRVRRLQREDNERDEKERQREEMEEEIKIGRIPEQYFQDWGDQNYDADGNQLDVTIIGENGVRQSHKSVKLRTLLIIEQPTPLASREKKKAKPRRRLLQASQSTLESYLDEIELIIYNKTCKYPDRYLHYLVNMNDSDIEVNGLVEKVGRIRARLAAIVAEVRGRYATIRQLEIKRRRVQDCLKFMGAMRELYQFKRQSQGSHCQPKQRKSTNELMRYIHQHPQLPRLPSLLSTKSTLLNIETLARSIRSQRLSYICDLLRKTLSSSLKSTYDRESWLKSELPKDVLMVDRMPAEVRDGGQGSGQGMDDGLNASYMNISVLDQSYCVGNMGLGSKKETSVYGIGIQSAQVKDLAREWQNYCKQYCIKLKRLQDEDQQIAEIFQRILLKFASTFGRDLQDYILHIYNQKSISPKGLPVSSLPYFIQAKFFNKISRVYYQALSTCYIFSLVFTKLPSLCPRVLKIVEQKIMDFVRIRNLGDYKMVEDRVIEYEDVVEVIGGLDYWVGFVQFVGARLDVLGDGDGDEGETERILLFEDNMLKRKNQMIEDFMANLHKFALINDLKSMIERQDFRSISIPVSSFSILDSIINWGQNEPNPTANFPKPQIEQSFNFGTAILNDFQPSSSSYQRRPSFSIFKVIDKKLIIEGKEYRICASILVLSAYLQVYLKAKIQFVGLAANMEERICELIGFYIWYCKKMVFSGNNAQHHDQMQLPNTNSTLNSKPPTAQKHPTLPASTPKKTLITLCMLINICDLLSKFMDILNITSKPKKVQKVFNDFKAIREEAIKEIGMVPFLEVERQISCLYESRLKTRKQIPTKQSIKVIEVLESSRRDLQQFSEHGTIKKALENSVKIISKNYFGYLFNMEARGKAELKWFIPKLREAIGDLFPDDVNNLEKQIRF